MDNEEPRHESVKMLIKEDIKVLFVPGVVLLIISHFLSIEKIAKAQISGIAFFVGIALLIIFGARSIYLALKTRFACTKGQ